MSVIIEAKKWDSQVRCACFLQELSYSFISFIGYGVELQIKSTEYKAQDDTKVKADEVAGATEQSQERPVEDEDIEGFMFTKLKLLHPDSVAKLDELKKALLDETKEMAPLKVWQLQELSLQAAERIVTATRDESLKIMAQLAQNFPLLARSLVRTTVRAALKKEIKTNQKVIVCYSRLWQ